jgi:selenocysteine lyase/cysteine desulfurase
MPCHANTHTNITYTGSQSTAFVAESRQIVAEMTGARITGKAATDVVLFGGNGTTGVVSLLLDVLNLRGLAAAASSATTASVAANNINSSSTRPVVFVGPHEHHSNLLPWRESGCEVVTISERPSDGTLDIDELERTLHLPQYGRYSGRLRIGAFAAVSNVTGLIANVDRIAILLHRHGALAFFDYASGAPYLKMDMNPPPPPPVSSRSSSNNDNTATSDDDPSKDAIYFSPHKLYGGTSTPGVLVIKKHLISQTAPPSVSGGGTVFYVTSQSHRFLSNRIERYEGGTPDGIGIQRVGLALLIGRKVAAEYERIVASSSHDETSLHKDTTTSTCTTPTLTVPTLPPKTLLEYECSTYDRVVTELNRHAPNLIILGRHTTSDDDDTNNNNIHVHEGIRNNTYSPLSTSSCVGRHLPIFSFLIRCGRRFLHYNYVCAILNDMFGIQSRGGCQCAGPYSQRLLGLTSTIRIQNTTADIVDDYKLIEVPSETNRQIELALLRSDRPCELLRPGYTRLSLPFKGLREEEVDYVIKALIWVAKNGWALLPQYRCDHRTGEWRHWSRRGKPLGKSERLWLSNYDILASSPTAASRPMKHCDTTLSNDSINQASRVRLKSAMENANAILRSTKSDPRFLSEAERMNPASGLLGSGGSHDDSGDGGVDHTLEELRWYVYPQEVSQYLREGLDEPPDTCDDDALIGAIDVRIDGKRRHNYLIDDDRSAAMLLEGNIVFTPPLQTCATFTLKGSNLIPFQEGDHVGEALYDDIKTGYEEGELGEACEVYSQVSDVWLPIARFLQEYIPDEGATIADAVINEESASRRKRNLSVMKDSLPSCIDSSPGSDVLPPRPIPPAIEKREKKKPSRDSSQWGQYSMPMTAPPPLVHDSPSKLAETATTQSTVETSSQVATTMSNKSMKNKGKIKPPPKLMRYVTQAMIQWDMIQEGDRLLLGLSGGKDSLSLLHILLEWQRKSPIKFDIEVCTIDPLTPSFDPVRLIPYVEGLGLKYHYIRDDIVQRAASSGKDGKTVSSLCGEYQLVPAPKG